MSNLILKKKTMIYDYGSLRKGKRKERMNVFLRTMFFCRYCNCCELIVFRGTFMWCFIECLFYWVRILAIYWKYRRNCLLRNTHYLFVQKKKRYVRTTEIEKKSTHFLVFNWNHISVAVKCNHIHFITYCEQYNMTLRDRRTFIVVGYW